MRTDRENFLDEDVLRIQNEVRRYHDEQEGIYDSNVTGEMQRGDSASTNTNNVSNKSRGDFLQNTPSATQRQ